MTDTPYIFAPGGVGVQYPLDAASVSVAAPTAANAWGVYTAIVASLGAHFICCGAVIFVLRTGGNPVNGGIELATGAAASEVAFERFGYGMLINDPTGDGTGSLVFAHKLQPFYIASGTRLAARQWQDHASFWSVARTYLYGYSVPSPEIAARVIDNSQLLQGHAGKGGDRLPNIGFTALTHSGAAWTAGAWVEIAASVAEDCVVEGMHAIVNTGRDYGIEFGVGAAGSEVLLPARLPMTNIGATVPYVPFVPCPMGLYVPKGARLAARQKANSTTGTISVAAKVSYLR